MCHVLGILYILACMYPRGTYNHYPYIIEEETEAQRSEVTCLSFLSKWQSWYVAPGYVLLEPILLIQ